MHEEYKGMIDILKLSQIIEEFLTELYTNRKENYGDSDESIIKIRDERLYAIEKVQELKKIIYNNFEV